MHARSSGSASAGVRDRLRLEWEIGLQRLPFFTQRLAVALLGLLVVSLALVGGMAILQGGQQGSDVQLRPQPAPGGAGQKAPPTTTAPPTSTPTSDEPTTTDGGILGPLPPVLSTLLN